MSQSQVELWNKHYCVRTRVDLARSKVSWKIDEPAVGVSLRIEVARNGFILHAGEAEVYSSVWDLTSRIRDLVTKQVLREEDYNPDHYDQQS